MKIINCVYCGNALKPVIRVHKEFLGDVTLNIFNTPMVKCDCCNEEYIPATTMDYIEQLSLYIINNQKYTGNIDIDFNNIPSLIESKENMVTF